MYGIDEVFRDAWCLSMIDMKPMAVSAGYKGPEGGS